MPRFRLISDIVAHKSGALVLPLRRARGKAQWSAAARTVDGALGGTVARVLRRGDFSAKAGEVCVLHAHRFRHERVFLAGMGEGGAEGEDDGFFAAFAAVAKNAEGRTVTVALPSPLSGGLLRRAAWAAAAGGYRFRRGGHFPGAGVFSDVAFVAPKTFAGTMREAAAVAEGGMQTRHLAEQPANVCDPPFLAAAARAAAKKYDGLRAEVLGPAQLRKLKMGALLAVAQGSRKPAQLIVLRYAGKRGDGGRKADVALVGKGVTFDTGGISLKPAAAMDEMKFDMAGAAAVFGTMCAVAKMRLPLNVAAVIPACENMPGGAAVKPGDVVVAMNGASVEVLNTDAEGRLILADALCYAQKRFSPQVLIDAATLTGACVIALGAHFSGMFSGGEALAAELEKAGEESSDRCWRLPLGAKYKKQLKSDYADLANIGGRSAGAVTAACFLSHFVEGGGDGKGGKCEWAHLDVAGTAWTAKKRATARPVPLLANYLRRRAKNKRG